MAVGQDRNHLFIDDRLEAKTSGIGDGRPDEGGIDIPFAKRLDEGRGVPLPAVDDHVLISVAIAAYDGGDQGDEIGRTGEADDEFTRLAARAALYQERSAVGPLDDLPRLLKQQPTRVC